MATNWIEMMFAGMNTGVCIYDDRAEPGEFTKRLVLLLSKHMRQHTNCRPRHLYVPGDTTLCVDLAYGDGDTELCKDVPVAGATILGMKAEAAPSYLVRLCVDSSITIACARNSPGSRASTPTRPRSSRWPRAS